MYNEIEQDGITYRVYQNSDEAWNALTDDLFNQGWRICNYGQYENCHYK